MQTLHCLCLVKNTKPYEHVIGGVTPCFKKNHNFIVSSSVECLVQNLCIVTGYIQGIIKIPNVTALGLEMGRIDIYTYEECHEVT